MKKIIQIILCSLIFFEVLAQQKENNNLFDIMISDAEIFFIDGISYFTYPIGMSGKEWLTTAGIGAGIYLSIQNDKNVRNWIDTDVNQFDDNFWRAFEHYGVIEYAEIGAIGTYAVGLFGNHGGTRKLGRMMFQSLSYSGLTAMFIRMIAGRKRPPLTSNHTDFIGFTSNNRFQSFPSGHTTVAFAFSTVLAEYFDSPWSRIGFYGLAGLAATERIINNEHWLTDVILGALIGIAGGVHVINEESKRENNSPKSKLTISPSFNGINFRYRLN